MRLRHGVAAAAAMAAMAPAAPAWAQHVEWRTSLEASGSYNQTITDGAYPTALTLAGPSMALSPSGVLIIDTPLTTNTLTYAFSLSLLFTKDLQVAYGPANYSNHFTYSGRYSLSELSTLTLTLGLNHNPLNQIAVASDPSQAQVQPVPAGAEYMFSLNGMESFSRQFSAGLSLTQSTSTSFTAPIDPTQIRPRTISVQNGLALSKELGTDALGVQATFSVSYFTAGQGPEPSLSYFDPHVAYTDGLQLSYSHPFSESFTAALTAGAVQVVNPPATVTMATQTVTAVEPSGSLALSYHLDPASATLAYAHSAAPNLATNAVTFTDSVTTRFSLPFGQTGLTASGSVGFTHSQPVGSTTGGPTNVFVSDASLAYHNADLKSLTFSMRGQLSRQGATPDASTGPGTPGYTHLGISFSVSVSYPDANAAQVGPQLPPPLGVMPSSPADVTVGERPFEAPLPEEPGPSTAP